MDDPERAIQLFLDRHAAVHSKQVDEGNGWSFEEEALGGLKEAEFRVVPAKEEHSIAWILWHLARIEDVTMNILVAGGSQVFHEGDWKKEIGFDSEETGNALDPAGIQKLSETVNVEALRKYRSAVGRRTRETVKGLHREDFNRNVEPARLDQIIKEGAVVESTRWLVEYWGKKTIGGLLLMPPTRHNFVHLNEVSNLKKKIMK
jgi:hypothetical protein